LPKLLLPWCALRWLLRRFGAPAFHYIGNARERLLRCSPEELDDELCQYRSMGISYAGGRLTELEKSFVQSCIAIDPAKRLTAEQLLAHPCLTQA
jgi:serine/threonine protein kinase